MISSSVSFAASLLCDLGQRTFNTPVYSSLHAMEGGKKNKTKSNLAMLLDILWINI